LYNGKKPYFDIFAPEVGFIDIDVNQSPTYIKKGEEIPYWKISDEV
jgi:hypothetical protein